MKISKMKTHRFLIYLLLWKTKMRSLIYRKSIRYNCRGTIDFKVNFDDEYSDLALTQKKMKKGNDFDPAISYSRLHK